jgi:hypothetical protein
MAKLLLDDGLVPTSDMPYPGIFAHPRESCASLMTVNPVSEKSPAPLRWPYPDEVHALR